MKLETLIKEVAWLTQQPIYRCRRIIVNSLDLIRACLEGGDDVTLLGFGRFYIRRYKRKSCHLTKDSLTGRARQYAQEILVKLNKKKPRSHEVIQSELADMIAEKAGITKKLAAEVVRHVVAVMKSELQAGRPVSLHSFGTFTPKLRKERNGVNPRTGKPMVIPKRKAISFKASTSIFNS